MARFSTEITIDGIPRVLSLFSRFGDAADNLEGAFEEIGDDFKRMESERFAAGGPGWAPLTPRYAAWKSAHYPGRPILTREGSLREGLSGGSRYIQRISRKEGEYGTSVPWAIYHQRGTSRMVARKPIEVKSADRTRWARIIQRHVVSAARGGAGGGISGAIGRITGLFR